MVPWYVGEKIPLLKDEKGLKRIDVPAHRLLALGTSEPTWPSMRHFRMSALNDGISRWVADQDEPVVVIAGDCVAAIGVEAGLQRRGFRCQLIWVDAHGDFHTPSTTPSGHVGGMPLAMLRGHDPWGFLSDVKCEPVEDVVHVGGSAFDPDELVRMVRDGVRIAGPYYVPPMCATDVHLHIDVDVVGKAHLPCVDYPTSDGWTAERLVLYVEQVTRHTSVRAISISSHNPRHPDAAIGDKLLGRLRAAAKEGMRWTRYSGS